MALSKYFAPAGAAVGTAFGGPLGGLAGGVAGDLLGGLFGGDDAEKAHQRRLEEARAKLAQDRAAQMQGRVNMTQNAGAAYAPMNRSLQAVFGGDQAAAPDLRTVFADPRNKSQAIGRNY